MLFSSNIMLQLFLLVSVTTQGRKLKSKVNRIDYNVKIIKEKIGSVIEILNHGGSGNNDCDADWKEFNGTCYKYSPLKTNRTEAFKLCKSSHKNPSSTLVSIPNNETNNFLVSLTKESAWTGGYRKSGGGWGWTDGSPWNWTNWSPGEPNNDGGNEEFVEINFKYGPTFGFWNDDPDVKFAKGALCQYDKGFDINQLLNEVLIKHCDKDGNGGLYWADVQECAQNLQDSGISVPTPSKEDFDNTAGDDGFMTTDDFAYRSWCCWCFPIIGCHGCC